MGAATARGNAGQPLNSEITPSVFRSRTTAEKATPSLPLTGKAMEDTAESNWTAPGRAMLAFVSRDDEAFY